MAKDLVFKLNGQDFSVSPVKFERKKFMVGLKTALFLTLISTFAYADNIPTYYAYEYNRLPEDVEVIEYNEPTVTTTTTTYIENTKTGRVGLVGGVAHGIKGVFNLVGDGVGEIFYQVGETANELNVAPERIVRKNGTVIQITQYKPAKKVLEYKEKCVHSPEIFSHVIHDYFNLHLDGFGYRYSVVNFYFLERSSGVLHSKVTATFCRGNEKINIVAEGKSTTSRQLCWILNEKVRETLLKIGWEEK